MRLPFFIARRYLFSKKKQSVINIISIISVIGVTIGTTALIVILSIFNGIDLLLQNSTNSFTPDVVISPQSGKFCNFDSSVYKILDNTPGILYHNDVIEEKSLVKYGEKLSPVVVKGVTGSYITNSRLCNNIIQGELALQKSDGYYAIVGYGVAAELGIGLNFLTPMIFYYPDKDASSALSALSTEHLYPSAFFSSQQDIDNKYVITDIDFARILFNTGDRISCIEIKADSLTDITALKNSLRDQIGDRYKIADKYELNSSFYAMMRSEKLAVFTVLLFILLVASFNIIGSISMLILDKKEDLTTYKALGMTRKDLISVFKTEGNLITWFGAAFGLVLGSAICLLQEKYGFITLGDGSYIISAYPVKFVFTDILMIIAAVIAIGYTASYFPVRYLINKLTR